MKEKRTMYKVIGVNEDKDFCSCCGKQNLKSVVWIENTETSEINHYGSICAAWKLTPAKSGKKVKVDRLASEQLTREMNEVALKHWGLTDRREFENAIGKELIETGVASRFAMIKFHEAFLNFINPYLRRNAIPC